MQVSFENLISRKYTHIQIDIQEVIGSLNWKYLLEFSLINSFTYLFK